MYQVKIQGMVEFENGKINIPEEHIQIAKKKGNAIGITYHFATSGILNLDNPPSEEDLKNQLYEIFKENFQNNCRIYYKVVDKEEITEKNKFKRNFQVKGNK